MHGKISGLHFQIWSIKFIYDFNWLDWENVDTYSNETYDKMILISVTPKKMIDWNCYLQFYFYTFHFFIYWSCVIWFCFKNSIMLQWFSLFNMENISDFFFVKQYRFWMLWITWNSICLYQIILLIYHWKIDE